MAKRRKNPDSAGLYIALVAGSALLYLLFRNGGNSAPAPLPPGESPPSDKPPGGSGGGAPKKGCHGEPFMPRDKALQLQQNLNAYFDAAGVARAEEDGYFGYWSARLLDYYRSQVSPLAEKARRTPTADSGGYSVLKNATIFYDPTPDDSITFDLYQKGCDQPAYTMRKSLYDKLTSPSFVWNRNDLNVAGL